MGRSRYLSSHSTRTASCYDADGSALDSRGFHVCDYAAANRTYAGYGRIEPSTPIKTGYLS